MTNKEIFEVLQKTGALLSGHFQLRSGLHSNRYFQCANVLRYPRYAGLLCEELVNRMKASGTDIGRVDGVISPAIGGILVGHEIARALDTKCVFAEKQDGKLVMHRFTLKPGERYIVGEDVITRGGRVQETIDIVEAAGAEVAAVLVLVDRSDGQAKFKYPTFSLLQMSPDVWEPEKCPLCADHQPFVHPGS